ncbi:MAG TPA: hypothetical protein VFZ24_08680 [Longimicrobiales bacterium]
MTTHDTARVLLLLTLTLLLTAHRAAAQVRPGAFAQGSGLHLHRLHLPDPGSAGALPDMRHSQEPRSPGWARFGGGLVTGTVAVIGLLAATWDSPGTGSDALGGLLALGVLSAGSLVGSAAVTGAYGERPNAGIVLGSLAGSLPIAVAAFADDDGLAEVSLLTALVTAPLGAAIGQAKGRD